jgi:8-oxo-dGTP diphosphatase
MLVLFEREGEGFLTAQWFLRKEEATMSEREVRDARGLTEAEFLRAYRPKDYPRPSLTADNCIFRHIGGRLELLLVRRASHPYLGLWALPGGFVGPDETAAAAAARELEEETNVSGLFLEPVGLYSEPGRDPRGWVVSAAYVSLVEGDVIIKAGDDAADASWFALHVSQEDETTVLSLANGEAAARVRFAVCRRPFSGARVTKSVTGEGLAFDHAHMIADAYLRAL